ncbi:putative bifunctional diguanylate cyclase/phosphodiesterase [Amorphus sp. MBR-141]
MRTKPRRSGRYLVRPAYLAVTVAGLALAIWLVTIDAMQLLFDFSRAHEGLQLDAVVPVLMVAGLVSMVILVLRERDVRREIHQRELAEHTAERLERYDEITGLPNRRLLFEELHRRIVGARMHGSRFALFFLDVDRFKSVNDTYGHGSGDELLRAIGERLVLTLRPHDFVARLGGDEYAVVINSSPEKNIERHVAQRILFSLARPFTIDGGRLDMTASIGIAYFPDDAENAELLMRSADTAMYRAKASGRNTFATFDKSMEEIGGQLRDSLAKGHFRPYYQPVIDLKTHKVVGLEALARWDHPTKGVLGPDTFVAVAEDAGLIDDLFILILKRLASDAMRWDPALRIAVNISPYQFRDEKLSKRIIACLSKTDFPADRLDVELTESALIIDVDTTRQVIGDLKEKGVRISLDDFGTGYSSLRYLRELPFDKIKIDRSFVQRMDTDPGSRKIIESIISLSHALGYVTVAEGVETKTQAKWLNDINCDLAQGYLFSRPLPPEEIDAFLTRDLASYT